jgi:hypothetical protein
METQFLPVSRGTDGEATTNKINLMFHPGGLNNTNSFFPFSVFSWTIYQGREPAGPGNYFPAVFAGIRAGRQNDVLDRTLHLTAWFCPGGASCLISFAYD